MGYAHNTTEISSTHSLKAVLLRHLCLSFPFRNIESNQFVHSQNSSILPTHPLDIIIISSSAPYSITDMSFVHPETPNAPHHGMYLAKRRQVWRGRGICLWRVETGSKSYLKSIEPLEETRDGYKDYDLTALKEHILKTKILTSIATLRSCRI